MSHCLRGQEGLKTLASKSVEKYLLPQPMDQGNEFCVVGGYAYDRIIAVLLFFCDGRKNPGNPGLKRDGYQVKPETKTKIEGAIWGAVGGAIVAIVIGFGVGGWSTSGGTQDVADAAVLTSRAAICVAQFMKEPNFQENLDDLQKVGSFQRSYIIESGGWDKMPGQEEAVILVSRACADGLELLMK